MTIRFPLAVLALLFLAAPGVAGNKLVAQGRPVAVAKSALTVTPAREWNKLGARPGRDAETWTLDGDALNDLTFYGGIEHDKALFREVSKKRKPLPRFQSTMLLTDVPALLENSYRIALDTPLMTIDSVEPTIFAETRGVLFRYTFTRQDEEVVRSGEARAAIIAGRLYMITFEAPKTYFFPRDVDSFRSLAATAKLG